jgi:hypothetical protein
MWSKLTDARLIEFYQSLGDSSQELARKMIDAVRSLQSHPAAGRLHCFTSHAHLQVTTAPSMSDDEGHYYFSIIWDYRCSKYRLYAARISDGWAWDPEDPSYASAEELPSALDRLIYYLFEPDR